MAVVAATTFAPSLNLSTPKHFLIQNAQRIKLKLTDNPKPQRISFLSPPISWSKAGHRSRKSSRITSHAYVSGAFDAIVSANNEPKIEDSEIAELQSIDVISWGLLWKLVLRHKWRVLASVITLLGGTTCMLAMPIYSGRFFEVLIGARQESIWKVLSKVAILYIFEPICTITFVINMNAIWEKVISSIQAQIFLRVLIQKVEFFDRYKVGELTALLTSDLGSIKKIVSENISRDRGFRAISEVIGTMFLLFSLSIQLAPVLGLLMLTVSLLVGLESNRWKRTDILRLKTVGMDLI